MALRVELEKSALVQALELQIGSLRRAKNSAKNPAFGPIYEKDIAALQNAINTLQDNIK